MKWFWCDIFRIFLTCPTVLSVCTIDITFTTRSHSLNWRAVKTPMGVFLPSTFFFISTYTPPVHWIIPCWLNGKTSTTYKEKNALLALSGERDKRDKTFLCRENASLREFNQFNGALLFLSTSWVKGAPLIFLFGVDCWQTLCLKQKIISSDPLLLLSNPVFESPIASSPWPLIPLFNSILWTMVQVTWLQFTP